MAHHKHIGDSKEVIGEFVSCFSLTSMAMNHDDLAVMLPTHPLNEVKGKATQAVFVEYHNHSDQAFEHLFQKPLDAFAGFPVEA